MFRFYPFKAFFFVFRSFFLVSLHFQRLFLPLPLIPALLSSRLLFLQSFLKNANYLFFLNDCFVDFFLYQGSLASNETNFTGSPLFVELHSAKLSVFWKRCNYVFCDFSTFFWYLAGLTNQHLVVIFRSYNGGKNSANNSLGTTFPAETITNLDNLDIFGKLLSLSPSLSFSLSLSLFSHSLSDHRWYQIFIHLVNFLVRTQLFFSFEYLPVFLIGFFEIFYLLMVFISDQILAKFIFWRLVLFELCDRQLSLKRKNFTRITFLSSTRLDENSGSFGFFCPGFGCSDWNLFNTPTPHLQKGNTDDRPCLTSCMFWVLAKWVEVCATALCEVSLITIGKHIMTII